MNLSSSSKGGWNSGFKDCLNRSSNSDNYFFKEWMNEKFILVSSATFMNENIGQKWYCTCYMLCYVSLILIIMVIADLSNGLGKRSFRWPLFFYLHQQFKVLIIIFCILGTTLKILDTQWNYMLWLYHKARSFS